MQQEVLEELKLLRGDVEAAVVDGGDVSEAVEPDGPIPKHLEPLRAATPLEGADTGEELVELARDCEIEAALTIGYGGFESYGFHALEAHQCLIERRRGGETGLTAVQAVTKEEIRTAETAGLWSRELFAAALKQLPGAPQDSGKWSSGDSAVYLLRHRDGLQSAVVMANGLAADFAFAVKLKGRPEPLATRFKLQEGAPYGHFAYLVRAIEHTILTGKAAYPVERTLLTTGILDRVMHSLAQGGKLLDSPELNVSYSPTDWPFANHPDSPLTLPND
jgi:hypothetical protein